MEIHGLDLDQAGRCRHYHLAVDVAALKCSRCQKYYACYRCHDALENHHFMACERENWPVLCGICGCLMQFAQYQQESCPRCGHDFNPGCRRHCRIYFK
ncbi:putative CHY-type Zn-finger protein [Limosilactobacillus mucosae]|uniref:CHY zinc finger protein n=1 Tax=Limosilactobacillus mucosae TaxID=97478 RepID=UPI00053C570E|nr:CHY zinc finger protein [Limosilactobacillus mucosae]PWJ45318.1 putative CHY-type Zn-finger protein [Limosilactobacillus mucosae]SUQ18553.1 Uncharacterized protein, contains Zn-finger domain of CHY type [Limosilactobacillus mucosae]